jgi:hypothetical protein
MPVRDKREAPPAPRRHRAQHIEPTPIWDKTEINNTTEEDDPLYVGITDIFEKFGITNPE